MFGVDGSVLRVCSSIAEVRIAIKYQDHKDLASL